MPQYNFPLMQPVSNGPYIASYTYVYCSVAITTYIASYYMYGVLTDDCSSMSQWLLYKGYHRTAYLLSNKLTFTSNISHL